MRWFCHVMMVGDCSRMGVARVKYMVVGWMIRCKTDGLVRCLRATIEIGACMLMHRWLVLR